MSTNELNPLDHDRLVRVEALKLQSDGYEVSARIPSWFSVPDAIYGYRPDIIAMKGRKVIIVEVKKGAIDWPKISALERYSHENPNVELRIVGAHNLASPELAADPRQRFLIAVAKLLGVNPTEKSALSSAMLCKPWLVEEIIDSIFIGADQVSLSLEKFNRLMVNCRRPLASSHFFDHFFGEVTSVETFESAVENYRIAAMLLFGNFKFSYRFFSTCSSERFDELIRRVAPRSKKKFTSRLPFDEIKPIPINDLHLLGYISGNQVEQSLFAESFLDTLIRSFPSRALFLEQMGAAKIESITGVLVRSRHVSKGFNLPKASRKTLEEVLSALRVELGPLIERQERARNIGRYNTERYLSLPDLDVYVATSMREPKDFEDQLRFTQKVFGHKLIKPLKLKYFDPTLSFVDDRITKGLVECLMLQRATVTIYNAAETDTMGKDSELAATLAQGKPVIVYVPTGSEKLDRRADAFRNTHPLGLQIDHETGVAHGIVVVRTPEHCAEVLEAVLLNRLKLSVRHEGGIYHLDEQTTQSTIRVVSDDSLLTHTFWLYFNAGRKELDPRLAKPIHN